MSKREYDHVSETLDALGLKCPLPVLKARKALKLLGNNAVLRVIADDPAAIIDVPHFCSEQGHTLLSQENDSGILTFLIKKSA